MNMEKPQNEIQYWHVNTLAELKEYSQKIYREINDILENEELYRKTCDNVETIINNNECKGTERLVFLNELKNLFVELEFEEGIKKIEGEIKTLDS